MIWYLLYPFRGTTEPPRLAHNHPIRKAFLRHGTATARHWHLSILLSVAIAVLLCYPVFFLYDNPTAGFTKLPHHVWTSARVYEGGEDTLPDVEMRQVWVHGSCMRALEPHVLLETLSIQDALLGRGFGNSTAGADMTNEEGEFSAQYRSSCAFEPALNASWMFHSPLMYWNCSAASIAADKDIIRTINGQSHRNSYVNFTLRPTSVFAGKSFARTKLLAADALVITLFDQLGYGIGEEWEARCAALAEQAPGRWSLYPSDGKVTRSQLYEFRFQPVSLKDDFFLAVAYCIMAFYVVVSLRKLRAVKSKFGLAMTVISQIAISILASFTICGMLRINLARIPREAYPFAVLVIGIENMFRLINAVLASPPELPTIFRVANALGEVGHLSLAAAGQNLLLLWLLSKVVSPGVAAFCAFAAVALVIDFVFHITFFTAVLSVDVRRMELQDSLERVNLAQSSSKTAKPDRQAWVDALLQGKLPFSTRMAGSAVTICFVLTLNWHFFEHESLAMSWMQFLRSLRSRSKRVVGRPAPEPPPINQARTPNAWLRMQEHMYAKDVIRFVKPHAHSFIARVYDPLIVVLKDSHRNGAAGQGAYFLSAIRDLIDEHFFPFALAVVFVIAIVTLLMNYLLWDELPDDDIGLDDHIDSILSIRSLEKVHKLDVVKLAGCGKGHLVSVSLDRLTSIWCLKPHSNTYIHDVFKATTLNTRLWPIIAIAMDDAGNWLAICTDTGRVAFWSIPERRFKQTAFVDLCGHLPISFSLSFLKPDEPQKPYLLVVTPDGRISETDVTSSSPTRTGHICQTQLVSVSIISYIKYLPRIISVTRGGHLLMTHKVLDEWVSEALSPFQQCPSPPTKPAKVRFVTTVSALCVIVAIKSGEVSLIDAQSLLRIHTLQTKHAKGHSLRVLHSRRRFCPTCGSAAIQSLSLVYTEAETQTCIMQTYTLDDSRNSLICLRPISVGEGRSCRGLDKATQSVHQLERPGTWEATGVQSIIGIRRRSGTPLSPLLAQDSGSSYFSATTDATTDKRSTLKRRLRNNHRATPSPADTGNDTDDWEAWTLSSTGEFHATPLIPRNKRPGDPYAPGGIDDEQLFIVRPGPIARLGKRSVAVGFGNAVKVIMLGGERFEEDADDYEDLAVTSVKWRRRMAGRKAM